MRQKKSLLGKIAVMLAAALLLTCIQSPLKAQADVGDSDIRTILDVPQDLSGKTVILHSNDVHGAIGRYAYIASVKENFQKRGAEVILVDCGDYLQGTPYVSSTKGRDAIVSMNSAGYQIVTIGNHEFDYGYDALKKDLAIAKFKVVCANAFDANGNAIAAQNTMYTTASGMKIGFFGMVTPESQTKANPVLIKGLTFLSGKEMYACAQGQVDTLKAQGADLVICLSHLGVSAEASSAGNSSTDLYKNTKGIDLMLDGHSHTIMTTSDNMPVDQTGTKFQTIGVVVLDNATKSIEDRYLIWLDNLQKEVRTDAVTTQIIKRVDAEYSAGIGTSQVTLNGEKAPGNRTEETNNGNFITDAMLWTINKTKGAVSVDDAHTVVITNGGGVRAPIAAGAVTKKDINTVLPFGNTITVVYVTGEELLEVLEASTFCTPEPVGGFPQTKGIKFTIDTRKSYAKGATYPNSTYCKPASINRVSIESINGQPFSKSDVYAVVTNNFCSAGGDTYYAFTNASGQFDTGIPLDEAVMDYVKTELRGTIGTNYAQPRGDITIIK
ncbi:bifunctional metallophosphatase/5'-nucleotidase [Butyrivibrio sp. VCB2006]|uniref:bifunctional metallophosphatase/5'-nucleotidase n=1 Tax=Butyrivibrio sp. VCB2006 TaxID=1280679 RepID=UPI00040B45F9|nr:bifunctional UDP-sugar hydrolase/5'-nucleotidase [Butyrivibrio sp. VCB2006]